MKTLIIATILVSSLGYGYACLSCPDFELDNEIEDAMQAGDVYEFCKASNEADEVNACIEARENEIRQEYYDEGAK